MLSGNKGPRAKTINIIIGEVMKMVELHEEKLIKLRILHSRTQNDNSGVNYIGKNGTYRLTQLGMTLCELITKFE